MKLYWIKVYLFDILFVSDYGLDVSAELESASQLRAAHFFSTQRPWLGDALNPLVSISLLLIVVDKFQSKLHNLRSVSSSYQFYTNICTSLRLLFFNSSGSLFYVSFILLQIFMVFTLNPWCLMEVQSVNPLLILLWFTDTCLKNYFLRYYFNQCGSSINKLLGFSWRWCQLWYSRHSFMVS